MSDKRYYVRVRGKVLGPLDLEQLKALRDRGQFHRFHEVSEDKRTWVPASSLAELFPGGPSSKEPERQQPASWEPLPETAAYPPPEELRPEDVVDAWQGLTSSAPVPGPATPSAAGGRAYLPAIQSFLLDPVGGLPRLCQGLPPWSALGLGLVICAVFDLVLVAGAWLTGWESSKPVIRNPDVLKMLTDFPLMLLAGLFPIGALAAALAVARIMTRRPGHFGFDVLIAAATLLPLGLGPLGAGLLARAPLEVVLFFYLAVGCSAVLILNSGLTRVIRLSDRGALGGVAVMLGLTFWLWEIVLTVALGR